VSRQVGLSESLAIAERQITMAAARVHQQESHLERLRQAGEDVTFAERLLTAMRQSLDVAHRYRDALLAELERADGSASLHSASKDGENSAPCPHQRDGLKSPAARMQE
jgi:hypothetical protein